MALDFETVIPCDGKTLSAISAEIAMCNNLLASASHNPKACRSVGKKMIKFFGDRKKAGCLHPCHELALSAYVTCAKVCHSLLPASERKEQGQSEAQVLPEEEVALFSQAAVGLGALALGCILRFTRVRNDDVAELEAVIGAGLRFLALSEEEGEAACGEACTARFVQVAREALALLGYVWAADPVVSVLLAAACQHAAAAACSPLAATATAACCPALSQAFMASSAISLIRR
jgi:hypothetical protein